MADRNREAITEKVREIAERVGASQGIEIVDVELVGGGRNRVLRMVIDRLVDTAATAAGIQVDMAATAAGAAGEVHTVPAPSGVTHADCEFISHEVGTILDVEDVIPGEAYTLEVSSPGVERKLTKPREFERFLGQKVKIVLRRPVENQRHWVGALKGFSDGVITIEPAPGKSVLIPLDQVEKANLKFEW
jgi:ribosome maturation factor RimP